jgi:hypothetical protein
MTKTNLEKAQDFVLGQCLSDYPPDATYAEICDWIACDTCDDETGASMVTIWEPFEDLDVVEIMDGMIDDLVRVYHA